jgi:putative hydrolase of the HAD superfamily
MGPVIEVVGVDGDDTLWHSETIFSVTHERMRSLLAPYVPSEVLDERLLATERRNLRYFGYGVKGFVLSMVETAIEVSDGRVRRVRWRRSSTRARRCSTTPSSCWRAPETPSRHWRGSGGSSS